MSSSTALSNAISKSAVSGNCVSYDELDLNETYVFCSRTSPLYEAFCVEPAQDCSFLKYYFQSIQEDCADPEAVGEKQGDGLNLNDATYEYKFVKYNKNTELYDIQVRLVVPDYYKERVETYGGDAYYKILKNSDQWNDVMTRCDTECFNWSPVIENVNPFEHVDFLMPMGKEAEYVFVEAHSRIINYDAMAEFD
jgi:hypothetical protein